MKELVERFVNELIAHAVPEILRMLDRRQLDPAFAKASDEAFQKFRDAQTEEEKDAALSAIHALRKP